MARIRRLLVVALVSGIAYSTFMRSSKGYCPGGVSGDSGFLDSAGNAVNTAPKCVQLTLGPSPFVYFAIATIILVAISMVLRRGSDAQGAVRTLDQAAAAIGIFAVASVIIAQVWFGLIPITEWSDSGPYAFYYPFPFGSVDLLVTPMNVP